MSLCRDTKCPNKQKCLNFKPNLNTVYFIERMFKVDPFKCEYFVEIKIETEKEAGSTKESDVFQFLRDIVNGIK